MSEPSFLRQSPGLTLDEIAALAGANLVTPTPHARRIDNIGPLDRAGPCDLGFLESNFFADAAAATHAGACFTTAALAKVLPAHVAVLVVKEPYRAFVLAARELFPHSLRPSSLYQSSEQANAHVHATARLESGVIVEPGAVIGPQAEIGSETVIGANAVIEGFVRIGRNCSIGPGTTIANALIGDRVIIHPGCRIGQDGFGFVMSGKGHLKIPQVGRVIIQDDVEIGAGTTVDRGAIRDTTIGEGTKIDNLVQVGHNVRIGRHCVVVAQSGLSGSTTLEDFVVLGARAGTNTNVTIGEGAQIAGTSVAHGDVPAGARWGGMPAKPLKQWFRELVMLERMARPPGAAKPAADE